MTSASSVPLIAILAGILFHRSDAKELRSEMKDLRSEIKDLRSEMNIKFSQISADLRPFYHFTGKLEACMDSLEKKQSSSDEGAQRRLRPFLS